METKLNYRKSEEKTRLVAALKLIKMLALALQKQIIRCESLNTNELSAQKYY